MAENNFEQILDEAMADELMELIQRRRSWPLTNRQQPQPSASGPQIGIGLANGARENGHNEMAAILEEIAKAKIDHVFEQFLADKSKSDSQRNAERRAGRRLEAYRTEMCKRFKKTGQCQYGDQCLFAHTEGELRVRNLHPNHKTKLCRNFSRTGSCRYGHHCQFIHRTPPNSPQDNFRPLAQSAFNFNIGGGMNGPLFVPQHPLVPFTSNPQYGSAFAFHQFGAQYTVINPATPAYVDHNGFGIPNGLFAASTPAGNTHFPFPPPEEYLRR